MGDAEPEVRRAYGGARRHLGAGRDKGSTAKHVASCKARLRQQLREKPQAGTCILYYNSTSIALLLQYTGAVFCLLVFAFTLTLGELRIAAALLTVVHLGRGPRLQGKERDGYAAAWWRVAKEVPTRDTDSQRRLRTHLVWTLRLSTELFAATVFG